MTYFDRKNSDRRSFDRMLWSRMLQHSVLQCFSSIVNFSDRLLYKLNAMI